MMKTMVAFKWVVLGLLISFGAATAQGETQRVYALAADDGAISVKTGGVWNTQDLHAGDEDHWLGTVFPLAGLVKFVLPSDILPYEIISAKLHFYTWGGTDGTSLGAKAGDGNYPNGPFCLLEHLTSDRASGLSASDVTAAAENVAITAFPSWRHVNYDVTDEVKADMTAGFVRSSYRTQAVDYTGRILTVDDNAEFAGYLTSYASQDRYGYDPAVVPYLEIQTLGEPASIGLLWAVNGDSLFWWPDGDPAKPANGLLQMENEAESGDMDAIDFVADLQSVTSLAVIGIQNRSSTDYYGNPQRAKIYVAPDESDPCFNPTDYSCFTQQINVDAPYESTFSGSSSDPNVIRWINVEDVDRRYVMVKITRNGGGVISSSNTYVQFQDVLAGSSHLGYSTAGRLFGLGEDTVSVIEHPSYPGIQLIQMLYYSADGTIDVVIDQGAVKDIQKLFNTNWAGTASLFNISHMSVWVTPGPGDPNNELSAGFDSKEIENYSVKIYPANSNETGVFEPSSYQAGIVREGDVVDVSRRYIRLSIRSNFWGLMGETYPGVNYNFIVQTGDFSVLGTDSIASCSNVVDLGLALAGDFDEDCYITLTDLAFLADEWLQCTDPSDETCQQTHGSMPTYYIAPAPAGGITVDGDLSDWPADSEWILLDKLYDGFTPTDVDDARCAFRWDAATDVIYIAVKVNDSDQTFVDMLEENQYETSDRVEIYSQGSAAGGTGWGAAESKYFDAAQHYIVGPKTIATGGHWAYWADLTAADPTALQSAVVVDGEWITYEFAVKQYDNYGGISGQPTVVTDLALGTIIGLDVAVGTRYAADSAYSMLAENVFVGKYLDAGQFQQYELTDELPTLYCGNWGYYTSDIFADCYVNLGDFAILAGQWLQCNDPEDSQCQHNW